MDVARQISVLGELNQLDRAIWALEDEVAALPGRLGDLEREAALRRAEHAAAAEELRVRSDLRRKHERELYEVEARARRSVENAGKVTNQAQYEAAEREAVKLGALASALEEEVLGLMEEVEALEAREAATGAVEAEAAAALAQARDAAAGRTQEIEAELARLRPERARVVAEVDPPLRVRYEGMKLQGTRGGVTSARDSICQVCRRVIPPQMLNEVVAFKAIHACPSCGKLIINAVRSTAPTAAE